jgi:hypothetical protein
MDQTHVGYLSEKQLKSCVQEWKLEDSSLFNSVYVKDVFKSVSLNGQMTKNIYSSMSSGEKEMYDSVDASFATNKFMASPSDFGLIIQAMASFGTPSVAFTTSTTSDANSTNPAIQLAVTS